MATSAVPNAPAPQAWVPPALSRALAALEETGIPVALLRGFEPGGAFTEVDLLVSPRYGRELSRALVSCGFAPLRAWGHRGHRFYLGYSAADQLWLKLDFVTGVPGADAERVLAARRCVDGLPRLDPDVESALLLLHVIVDKGGRLGRHGSALRGLAAAAPPPPPGASAALVRLWPELWSAVAGSTAGLPEALVRDVADLLAPHRGRRARWDRWLRRASYLRRALRPTAPTVLVSAAAGDGRASEHLVGKLGPGARRVSVRAGRGPVALLRRRLTVELERRRKDGPVVVEAGPGATGLARADVTVPAPAGTGPTSGAGWISEAVWRAYRRRLLWPRATRAAGRNRSP